jgi:hypothetical protein
MVRDETRANIPRFHIRLICARQDSNPQPSRYERPALTIELQAHEAEASASCCHHQKQQAGHVGKHQSALYGPAMPLSRGFLRGNKTRGRCQDPDREEPAQRY